MRGLIRTLSNIFVGSGSHLHPNCFLVNNTWWYDITPLLVRTYRSITQHLRESTIVEFLIIWHSNLPCNPIIYNNKYFYCHQIFHHSFDCTFSWAVSITRKKTGLMWGQKQHQKFIDWLLQSWLRASHIWNSSASRQQKMIQDDINHSKNYL